MTGGIHGEYYAIVNSIIAGNTSDKNSQIRGIFHGESNLVQDSIVGLLDPILRDNGGPAKTHALLLGSAAISAGSNAAVTAAGLTADQRGGIHARIFDGTVDIGAIEFDDYSLVVDTLSDTDDGDYSQGQLSLREAIRLANERYGADTITFAEALAGQTISLNSELVITDALTIQGNTAAPIILDAAYHDRLLNIDDGQDTLIDVTVAGLSLTRGKADQGGAIRNRENLFLTDIQIVGNIATEDGGGIYHTGGLLKVDRTTFAENVAEDNGGGIYNATRNLIVADSLFRENTAGDNGGGIFNRQGVIWYQWISGPLPKSWVTSTSSGLDILDTRRRFLMELNFTTITNTTFSKNTALAGGGFYHDYNHGSLPDSFVYDREVVISPQTLLYNGDSNTSGLLLEGTSFRFNTGSHGGAVFVRYGQVTLTDSEVSLNSATHGGGIYLFGGDLDILHSDISTNSAVKGGGIYSYLGRLLISESSVTGNVAEDTGGGLQIQYPVTIENSTISGNQADYGGGVYIAVYYGKLTLVGSTLADNTATFYGGGICSDRGFLILTDSTLSGNHAGVSGGGIYYVSERLLDPPLQIIEYYTATQSGVNNDDYFLKPPSSILIEVPNYSLRMINCTVTGNSAAVSAGGIAFLQENSYSHFTINNSIIAGNSSAATPQVEGTYGGGSNIIQDSIDGLLDPVLSENGGPTKTHALLPGSAAINAGNNAAVEAAGLETDQRGAGYSRIKGGTVDIGAFETQAPFAQVDLRFTDSRTRTSRTGENNRLPANRNWIDRWGDHWLEIWISTPGSTSNGVQSAGFQLDYDPQLVNAAAIEYGPAFSGNQSDVIDNNAGTITGLAAETMQTDVGDDQYVLFARIRFESPDGNDFDTGEIDAEQNANPQFSLTPSHVHLVNGEVCDVVVMPTPALSFVTDLAAGRPGRSFDVQLNPPAGTELLDFKIESGYPFSAATNIVDASQLSLIVLPYTQSFLADENTQPMPLNGASQTTGDDSAETRKTDISDSDGEKSLLDDYFSGLNDTSRLLTFET